MKLNGKLEWAMALLLPLGASCAPLAQEPALVTRTVTYQGISVEVVIDLPEAALADAVILFHGTVFKDSLVMGAARRMLVETKAVVKRTDILYVSIAYPEQGLLMGDNLPHAEAALMWVKHHASQELGLAIRKTYMLGHSQGGYLVTRLNTLYETDGVVANAPGPLNLVLRCGLEELGQAPATPTCQLLAQHYGSTTAQPAAYQERSLLSYTSGYRSRILFVQGLNDGSIQMASWPAFQEKVSACTPCAPVQVVQAPGYGHEALFHSPAAIEALNRFLTP